MSREMERSIGRKDLFRILQTGHCNGEPTLNDKGEWEVVMVKKVGGYRDAGAVTIILNDEKGLVIKTVEWMDLK